MMNKFKNWLIKVSQNILAIALVLALLFGSVSVAIWSIKWFLQLVGVM